MIMKFKIVNRENLNAAGWCDNIIQANKLKKEFYNIDIKLYGYSKGYSILLNEDMDMKEAI